jgi:hypothetical protein
MLRSYHAFLCLALHSQNANFDKLPLSQYRKYMGKGLDGVQILNFQIIEDNFIQFSFSI